ncbi:hypothetical protein GPALN_004035 [Globodera pallida]|nr:hypothetical protein GPALN_004035 [Globodera pallida]
MDKQSQDELLLNDRNDNNNNNQYKDRTNSVDCTQFFNVSLVNNPFKDMCNRMAQHFLVTESHVRQIQQIVAENRAGARIYVTSDNNGEYALVYLDTDYNWSSPSITQIPIILGILDQQFKMNPPTMEERERAYEAAIFPPLNRPALLLRVHANLLPVTICTQYNGFSKQIQASEYEFLHTRLRDRLDEKSNEMKDDMFPGSLDQFYATYQYGQAFVILHLEFDFVTPAKLHEDLQSLLNYLVIFVDETYPNEQNA